MRRTSEGPTIFFNIGWMADYRGVSRGDTITGGGGWVAEHGVGHEIYNFAPHRGSLYGCVQPPGLGTTIAIERLGASPDAKFIDGVTVAWVAKRPSGGLCLVGWYRNARVYRHIQHAPSGAHRPVRSPRDQAGFLAKARVADGVVLPRDDRKLEIPRNKRGAMGQSNVWFAAGRLGEKTIAKVEAFIAARAKSLAQRGARVGAPRQPDPERKARIEQAAVRAVRLHYFDAGYKLRDVQKDNVGWDLEATRGDETLLLEVKGLSGAVPAAEVTPNEYASMQKHWRSYRLCIVTSALAARARYVHHVAASWKTRWADQHDNVFEVSPVIGARVGLRALRAGRR